MSKLFPKLYWRLRIVQLALRWVFKINLGDHVIYKDRRCIIVNGVQKPLWHLLELGTRNRIKADECDFKKVVSVANYWHSFGSGYRFYMANWYPTWQREGVQDWMRKCNIWAGRRPL